MSVQRMMLGKFISMNLLKKLLMNLGYVTVLRVNPWRPKHFLEKFFVSNAAMWKRWKIDEKQLWPKKIWKFYVE